jgi:hypothetical protein
MLQKNLFRRSYRHHCPLYHLLAGAVAVAGAVAGAAFLSSFLAGLLVAGVLAASLTTTGASALVTAGVATGALGASAAKTDTDKTVAAIAINCFMLISYVI